MEEVTTATTPPTRPFSLLVLWVRPEPDTHEPCYYCQQQPSTYKCQHFIDIAALHVKDHETSLTQGEDAWKAALSDQQSGTYQHYADTYHCTDCTLALVVRWIGPEIGLPMFHFIRKEPVFSIACCAVIRDPDNPVIGSAGAITTRAQDLDDLKDGLQEAATLYL